MHGPGWTQGPSGLIVPIAYDRPVLVFDDEDFAPTQLPSLLAWYRADLGITLNGSNVSAWADQSGNGDSNRNAVQATAANQPTFVTSDTNMSGRPSVSFDGSNDILSTGTWSASYGQPNTIYTACRQDSGTGNVYVVSSPTQRQDLFNHTPNPAIFQTTTLQSSDSMSAGGIACVICGVFNSGSSAIYVSKLTGTTGSAGTATTPTKLNIGAFPGAALVFPGSIAEVIVYAGAHSATDRYTVMRYMGIRYGIGIGA